MFQNNTQDASNFLNQSVALQRTSKNLVLQCKGFLDQPMLIKYRRGDVYIYTQLLTRWHFTFIFFGFKTVVSSYTISVSGIRIYNWLGRSVFNTAFGGWKYHQITKTKPKNGPKRYKWEEVWFSLMIFGKNFRLRRV
jgi:hypothetical protein